jgi:transcriptional regulator with PAS, ATPase and Fis domain
VNCSAIPKDLAESLFFGHVKGAFSGATSDKRGYFHNSGKGTIFLDEIADLPLPLQAKMLRVLEAGKLMPLGSSHEVPVDVRVVAATNADVQGEIAAGKFREDLYYRLARYVIELPPLRERREDIPALTEHFLKLLAREMGFDAPGISAEALTLLNGYGFPGNVRELRNVLERALIDAGGGNILPAHLHFTTRFATEKAEAQSKASSASPATSEEERILEFAQKNGSINNAQCRHLLAVGIHRAWYLLRKLNQQGRLQQESSGRWARYRIPG